MCFLCANGVQIMCKGLYLYLKRPLKAQKMNIQINLYLDQRRLKSGSVYPVKIRVWNGLIGKARLFPTNLNLSEKDFQSAWISKKPRKEYLKTKVALELIKSKAQNVVVELNPFTFEGFQRKMYRKTGDAQNIIYHYQLIIEQLTKNAQIGSASSYDLSLKSIKAFLTERTGKTPTYISFYEITHDFLNEYEKYMVKQQKRSLTTVGIYLRSLRAIFNKAIEENEIKNDIYPFGKRKYRIPASENVKKALNKDELKILFEITPKTMEQQKAKDFWFFSYFCNGMNFKDIALLRFKDIQNGAITFHRAKTINTSKGNKKLITVYLNEYTNQVMRNYGSVFSSKEGYVFNIINATLNPTEQKKAIQNFTRFVNQHLKNLCKQNKLPEVSTYWARHTFATNSIRNGASMEFIQESLGHGDLKTTMNYFAGFEDETKREFAKKLMNF